VKRALAAVVAVLAIGAGVAAYLQWRASAADAEAVADLRMLQLPDLAGARQSLAQWEGKVLIVNFWATWCEPCREEVPALSRTRRAYQANGVEVVGIAVDSASKVAAFAKELDVPYPLLLGGLEVIDLSRRLGNRVGALPYTLVLDRNGRLVLSHLGAVTEQQLRQVLAPLLAVKSEKRASSYIRWTSGGKSAENPPHARSPLRRPTLLAANPRPSWAESEPARHA
jgi:thiol-disulfide isomerase/thioredoxin